MISHWRKALPQDKATTAWLDRLDEVGDPGFDVALPRGHELAARLVELAVPHEDIDPMVAGARALRESKELWFLLRRSVHAIVRSMGEIFGEPPLASPAELGPYFWPYVYVATAPHSVAYHRELGIPERITRETFADLGRNMAVHRSRTGRAGLNAPYWLLNHARGTLFQLGRLQFERVRAGNRTSQSIAAAGHRVGDRPYQKGDPLLSVHVPEFYGSITPEACDDSFARAMTFFPRHFPDERYEFAACYSWLLDDQLADYLPADSNIVRFQRRFRFSHRANAGDEDIVRFVVGRELGDPADLPQGTTLEKAIRDHLVAGRHWHGGAGWIHLGR